MIKVDLRKKIICLCEIIQSISIEHYIPSLQREIMSKIYLALFFISTDDDEGRLKDIINDLKEIKAMEE